MVIEEDSETGEAEEEVVTYREDADGDIAVDEDYAPMEMSLTTEDDKDRQCGHPGLFHFFVLLCN